MAVCGGEILLGEVEPLRRAATTVRVAVHSLAGCFFYGAFVAKVLLVQTRGPHSGRTSPVAATVR